MTREMVNKVNRVYSEMNEDFLDADGFSEILDPDDSTVIDSQMGNNMDEYHEVEFNVGRRVKEVKFND